MTQAKIYRRRWMAVALASACTFTLPVMAEIPTPALAADGGPPAAAPKPSAPRVEQRTVERQNPAAPSQG
jgi:hypothetical protein